MNTFGISNCGESEKLLMRTLKDSFVHPSKRIKRTEGIVKGGKEYTGKKASFFRARA